MPKKHRVKRQQQYDRTKRMDQERRIHIANQQEKGRLRQRGEASKRERPDTFRPEDDEVNMGFADEVVPTAVAVQDDGKKHEGIGEVVVEKPQSKAAQAQQAAIAEEQSKTIETRNKIKSKFSGPVNKAGAASAVGEQTRSTDPSKLRRVEDD